MSDTVENARDEALEENRTLYERDFYAWTQDQAARLRARALTDLDWEALAEEIESLGARDKREIRSRMRRIVQHLLKWQFQPEKRKWSWKTTLDEQRDRLAEALSDSPSLRHFPEQALASAWRLGVIEACKEVDGWLPRQFSDDPIYDLGEIFDPGFLPGEPWDPDAMDPNVI